MKQIPLVKIDHPGIIEYVREKLRDFEYRQAARDAKRAKERARNRRRPGHAEEPDPTLFDQENTR